MQFTASEEDLLEKIRLVVREELRPILERKGEGDLLTAKQLAAKLNVSAWWVYFWVRHKENPIPYERVGSMVRFDLVRVMEWKKTVENKPKRGRKFANRLPQRTINATYPQQPREKRLR